MRWLKPRRLSAESSEASQREYRMLAHSMVHPAADGSVLLEAGAPMTDGSTAYLIWLRVDDSRVEIDNEDPYASAYLSDKYSGPLGRYEGRWYSHEYDEGGLASAKYSGEQVAKEAAP
jgi:hypothetical protein